MTTLLENLRRATFAIEAKFADGEPSLTAPQFQLLLALERGKNQIQRELTDKAGVDRSSSSEVFLRLQEDGLITRKRDKRDKRAMVVSLTEEGRAILKKAKGIMAELERSVEQSGVDIDTLTQRLDVLAKLRPPHPPAQPPRRIPGATRRAARP